jgi:hypothetical protein
MRNERHDEGQPLSREDEAFVRSVADLFAASPLTASQRTRFDARLEERIRDRAARRQPWFAVAAVVAATLSLPIWRATIDTPLGDDVTRVVESEPTQREIDASANEWILAMTTDPVTDSDDTLPPDYLAISDLLLGN